MDGTLTAARAVPAPSFAADFRDPVVHADPYPTFARLRREAPVARIAGIGYYQDNAVVVSRYGDVVNILKDNTRYAHDRRRLGAGGDGSLPWWMPRSMRLMFNTMVSIDDPAHARLRSLVHKAFTPRMIENLTGEVERITHELLDAARKKPVADFIEDFALPLPLTVISDMLGVPQPDRIRFRRIMEHLLDAPPTSFNRILRSLFNNRKLIAFLDRLIDHRRREPDGGLITALLSAEEGGDRLSRDEVTGMVFLLLLAGHETTVNLLGNGTFALLQNPDQLDLLRRDRSFVKPAVEEMLRYTNPVAHGVMRYALEDIEIDGVIIPRKSTVVAMLASANRDETAFEDADKFLVSRDPNRHVAFGLGIHFCLGAPLSRMEGAVALNILLERFPNLSLAVPASEIRWRGAGTLFRALKELPVRLNG